jgi:hypothetical protein
MVIMAGHTKEYFQQYYKKNKITKEQRLQKEIEKAIVFREEQRKLRLGRPKLDDDERKSRKQARNALYYQQHKAKK